MWIRKTAVFLASQTLSLLGSSLVQYALMWYVTLETKSGTWMTLFIVCGFLPTFFLSPFGGVWADRYDRKRMIMLSDGMIALVTLGLAFAFMQGEKSLWLILLAAAVRAAGTAIQGPAVGAILPQFVPPEHLARVNGISGAIQAVMMLVSPVFAGAMISFWPMHLVFFVDVVTAALAIGILLFFLKVQPHEKALERVKPRYFADMAEGFRYIRDHRYLLTYYAYLAVMLFLIAPASFLTPLQVARSFGGEVWRLTAIEIAFSVGMLVGGAVISLWSGFRNRMHTMALATAIMGVCTLALGFSGVFWVYLAVMAFFGVSVPFFNTPATVYLQEHVEESFMGRVFSVYSMLFASLMPMGMLLFGPLAEAVKVETILMITGSLILLVLIGMLGNRRLLESGMPRQKTGPETATVTNGVDTGSLETERQGETG